MKTKSLFLLALLAVTNVSFAGDAHSDEASEQEVAYEEVQEEVVEAEEYPGVNIVVGQDSTIKDSAVAVNVPAGTTEVSVDGIDPSVEMVAIERPDGEAEVYRKGPDGDFTERTSTYRGLTLLGVSFEHGPSGGNVSGLDYSLTKNGGRLSLSLPVIGTDGFLEGGDSVFGANLGRLRIDLGMGNLNTSIGPIEFNEFYAHGTVSPTLGLFTGDQPRVYERGTAQPNIFGVELGPSVGFMCDTMDDSVRTALGITNGNCHATVGGIFQTTISYLSAGVEVKHHLGQEDNSTRDDTEVIFNFGVQIPFSHNTVDTDVDDSGRGFDNKEDSHIPGRIDVSDESRAVTV